MRRRLLLMMLLLLPLVVSRAATEINGIYYNLNTSNKTVEVTSGSNKYTGSVTIPKTVTYSGVDYSVTSIGNSAFQNCSGLTDINIPNSVTSIGNSAFYGTAWYNNQPNGLIYAGKVAYKYKGTMPLNTNIVLEEGTLGIAADAFYGCSGLTDINIPNSVTNIGSDAFYGCSGLTDINIPNSVTNIGSDAFYGCSGLTSINIPNSVTSIGSGAFSVCSGLTDIVVETSNSKYDSRENCNAIIEIASNKLIAGCKNTVIPNSVKSIGDGAFSGCSGLTDINIPNSLTSIGVYAFLGCSGLTDINIPNSLTSIGDWAFANCSGLTDINIPNSVTSIGDGAFWSCSGLTDINIPNSVTSIGDYAFQGCSGLTDINIPNSVTSIGNSAFVDCSGLTDINIPNSVTSIGNGAFYGCSGLTDINIPNSVTSIGSKAFYGCRGLTDINIPNSVTNIGSEAFAWCSGLTDVFCKAAQIPTTSSNAFNRSPINNVTLHVPASAVEAYSSTAPWSGFKEVVAIDEPMRTITVLASQQTDGQDELLKKVYWDGEKMVYPVGFENYDNKLNFLYTKESGIYSDYCVPTLTKDNWNYPGELLSQLKSISSNNKIFAVGYDFIYDGDGFDFVDGRYRSFEDSILVQVSPADMELTNAEISLLNSKGEDVIDAGFVELAGVKKYNEDGFWTIKFRLNNAKVGDLLGDDADYLEDNYAVALKVLNNNVVSDYNLCLGLKEIKKAYDFNVNDVSVAQIHNRYICAEEDYWGRTLWTDDSDNFPDSYCNEMTWHGDAYTSILFKSNLDSDEQIEFNACDRHGHSITDQRETSGTDNRHTKQILPVQFNCEMDEVEWAKIDIEFPTVNENGNYTPIRGFFVMLDQNFTRESSISEVSAWTQYIYKNVGYVCVKGYDAKTGKFLFDEEREDSQADIHNGIHKAHLFKGNKGTICIKDARNLCAGDVLGFRVHAVNLDGTLTDPDGRAFYVKVDGNEKLTFNIQADTLESYTVSNCDVTLNPSDNYKVELTWRGNNPAIRAAGTGTEAYMPVAGTNGPLRVEDFFDFQLPTDDDATMRAAIKANVANRLIDGATYKITMKILREVSQDEWTVDKAYDINIKKVMPTALPENFKVKSGQPENGFFIVYFRPNADQDTWKITDDDSHSWGVDARPFTLEELFNGIIVRNEDSRHFDKNYFFEIANSGEDGSAVAFGFDESFTNEQHEDGGYHLPKIHWSHVDDGELHEMKAGYIYRNISATLQADGKAFLPPLGAERYGESSGIANQDYRFDAIPFKRGDGSFFKLKYSCALDAALTMTVDDVERKFEYNQDVYVNMADAKFKLSNTLWAEDAGYKQAYFNAKLPIKTMKEVLTLSDMLAQSYFQIDVNSLKVSATNPVGLDFSHYSSPFFSVGETAFNPDENSITQIDGIKMYRNAALMENFKTAECALSFDIYDVWQHKRTVSIPFVIDGPVNPEDPKPGDLDGNGNLDYSDVMALSAIVVSGITGDDTDPAADFNGDGEVDINDITALIEMLTHLNQ